MHADNVEGVIVAELELETAGRQVRTPAMAPITMAHSGETTSAAGVMATRPATIPEAAPMAV